MIYHFEINSEYHKNFFTCFARFLALLTVKMFEFRRDWPLWPLTSECKNFRKWYSCYDIHSNQLSASHCYLFSRYVRTHWNISAFTQWRPFWIHANYTLFQSSDFDKILYVVRMAISNQIDLASEVLQFLGWLIWPGFLALLIVKNVWIST